MSDIEEFVSQTLRSSKGDEETFNEFRKAIGEYDDEEPIYISYTISSNT